MSYTVQKKEGKELNRLFSEDIPVHDWFRFVLSYPPHLVRNYLEKFEANKSSIILDPFAGTGTTLVECKKNGFESIGIEANPIANFASNTKCNWSIDSKELLKHSEKIALIAEKSILSHLNGYKVLNEVQNKLLITDSIGEKPLHKALILLETINKYQNPYFDYEKLAFAKQLVFSYSNLKFGPEVGVSRKKKDDVEVVELWLEGMRKIAYDLDTFSKCANVNAKSYCTDSRNIVNILKPDSIDFIITSPPYPNEKDYTRTTRLESVILGYINNPIELREMKKGLLRSNTRNVYKGDMDGNRVNNIKSIVSLSNQIENKRIELGKTSGFERLYHKVVMLYFGGMASHLSSLKPFLKPNAKLAYVVGQQASFFQIPIKTADLLGEVAESVGYKVVSIDLFRERYATANKTNIKEEVLILENPR
jgi:DNA modification methylase